MGLLSVFRGIFSQVEPPDPKLELVADCLAQLHLLNITPNTYLGDIGGVLGENRGASLKENIDHIRKKCEVCVLGGIFLSYVDKYNKVTLDDISGWFMTTSRYKIVKILNEFFGNHELDLIELAFEGSNDGCWCFANKTIISDEEIELCANFYNKYIDPTERFRAILKNILEHGEFKPEEE